MAKKSSVEKELRREKLCAQNRAKREELKKKASNLHLSEEEREAARIALNKMPRNSNRNRLRNRCQMTGRARGYLRKFSVSRLVFREWARAGLIPGLFKASW